MADFSGSRIDSADRIYFITSLKFKNRWNLMPHEKKHRGKNYESELV